MYGIVNKVISDYITARYGAEMWDNIQKDAGVDVSVFVLNETYPDDMTEQLLNSASKRLGKSLRDLKLMLGEHWVENTGLVNAPLYMLSAADDLKTFLLRLPELHSRVMLFYPKALAPDFDCSDVTDSSLTLHYYSKRAGLTDYVEGLLLGLGKHYGVDVHVTLLATDVCRDRADMSRHAAFRVAWR
ncbi:MAG: heme NO-binding domain-containing protein [Methylocystis sp.]|uniref:heme NO-binding domain-containing protein n=1 Tax=Methylocystis sp. TaxID=1911079 RepID=UPI003DA524EB